MSTSRAARMASASTHPPPSVPSARALSRPVTMSFAPTTCGVLPIVRTTVATAKSAPVAASSAMRAYKEATEGIVFRKEAVSAHQIRRRIDVTENASVVDLDLGPGQPLRLDQLAQRRGGGRREDRRSNGTRQGDRMARARGPRRDDEPGRTLVGLEDGRDGRRLHERHVARQDEDGIAVGGREARLNRREHAAVRIRIHDHADSRIPKQQHTLERARLRGDHDDARDMTLEKRADCPREERLPVQIGRQLRRAEAIAAAGGGHDGEGRHARSIARLIAGVYRRFGRLSKGSGDHRMALIDEGKKAPAFSLKDQDGKPHKLSDYAGKSVVLYFYPKDDTPGCTKESCDFRDNLVRFNASKASVLGISILDEQSKAKFAKKYDLKFPLLADADHGVAEKYGVWQKKMRYGRSYMGIVRTTYLIGPDGKVAKRWDKVKVEGHAGEVLKAIAEN